MKKLIIFTLMFLFLFSMVSAVRVDYSPNDKGVKDMKAIVKDTILFGLISVGEQGTMELKSHKTPTEIIEVGTGWQVTMIYDTNFGQSHKDVLGDVYFYDLKTGEEVEREYKFVYWGEEIRQREVCNEYQNITNSAYKNATSYTECVSYINESYTYEGWLDYDSKDLPKGQITLGLMTNVLYKDKIDGVWEIQGKKIDKHAGWIAGDNILAHGLTLENGGAENVVYEIGANVTFKNISEGFYLQEVEVQYHSSKTKISYINIRYDNGTSIAQSSLNSRGVATFNISLQNNINYHILGGHTSNFYPTINTTMTLFPYSQDLITWNNGSRFNKNTLLFLTDSISFFNIKSITVYNSNKKELNITLLSPENYYNSTNQTIDFSANLTDEKELGIANVSLVINDTIYDTNISGDTGIYNFSETLSDGFYEWYIEAYDDTDKYYTSEIRYFTIDILAPEIEILSPVTSYDYLQPNQTIDLNFSITDASDHLDSCWYEYNSNITYFNCSENQTFNYIPDQNTLTVNANDTFGNEGSESVNWDYKLLEHFFNYTKELYETENTKYLSKLSYDQSNQVRVILDINGTNHTLLDRGNQTFEKSLDFPLVNSSVNVTSKLYYFYDDVMFNEKEFNQTIHPIIFQLCNATINTITLNYTINDELTESLINSGTNPTTFKAYNNFWLGNGDVKKEYTTNELNQNKNNYTYCIFPSNKSYKTNMNIEFSATGYTPRQYSLVNAIINNQTNIIKLFLLNADDSVKFNIDVKKGVSWLQNANIIINKYYLGSNQYIPLSIRTTDSSGKFIEYFEVDSKIRFDISKDNVFLGSIERDALCLTQPCEMTLNIEEVTTNPFYKFNETFAENVVYSLDYNATTKLMTASFLDTSGLANYFRFEVKRVGDELGACNTTVYTTSGSITCDLTNKQGDYIGTLYISRSPEKIVDYIFAKLQGFVDALGKNGLLIALMVIVIVGLIGSWNPAVGVLMMSVAILLMSFLNFVAFSQTTVMLILILAIIIIVRLKS